MLGVKQGREADIDVRHVSTDARCRLLVVRCQAGAAVLIDVRNFSRC
jgi:hypothetical protein